MRDVHKKCGERSLRLHRELSDKTDTHRHHLSVIAIVTEGILEVDILWVYHSGYIS